MLERGVVGATSTLIHNKKVQGMADIVTLIPDIHKLLEEGKEGVNEKHLKEFFNALRDDIAIFLSSEKREDKSNLRMSSIGKGDRKLWYEINKGVQKEFDGQTRLKFFFGNLVESFLLFLVQESGHLVTDRQKEVVVNGVKGHIDCKIDGIMVDVKSASDFSFKKFKNNTLHVDDPFGYIAQLSGYIQAEGGDNGYFLAYNKNNADMTLLELDELTMIDAGKRINDLKKLVKSKQIPDKCYEDVPDGKQGNRILDKNCFYCDYKIECWQDANKGKGLRVFSYANGPVYFTHVEKAPRVEELKG